MSAVVRLHRAGAVRADDDAGPYPMCPTCQWQGGGLACDACEGGDMYEIHPEIEEEFFS